MKRSSTYVIRSIPAWCQAEKLSTPVAVRIPCLFSVRCLFVLAV